MANVTYTMTATLAGGITAAQLRDGLCTQWGYNADEHGTKAEFINFMLLRYVKQTWKAYRGKVAGSDAQDEAEDEVQEVA